MNEHVRQKLIALNKDFYRRFAASFSDTRFAPQPGYTRIIRYVPPSCHVLDLGCGNARFAHFLDQHVEHATYLGVDVSPELITLARASVDRLQRVTPTFLILDLSQPDWAHMLPQRHFHLVVAFAVIHHIPDFEYRAAFLQGMARLVREDGYIVLSTWRFLHSERMRRKIVPWDRVGLSAEDVDEHDYLMDWKRDGVGYRYVHYVSEAEMDILARRAGLSIVEQFYSDGREGDLSLYTVCQLAGGT